MNNPKLHTGSTPRVSALSTNKVLRNTYALLSVTLIFSALMAAVSTMLHVGHGASLACSVGALLLIWFVLPRTAESATGIAVVFAFTGLIRVWAWTCAQFLLEHDPWGRSYCNFHGGHRNYFHGALRLCINHAARF